MLSQQKNKDLAISLLFIQKIDLKPKEPKPHKTISFLSKSETKRNRIFTDYPEEKKIIPALEIEIFKKKSKFGSNEESEIAIYGNNNDFLEDIELEEKEKRINEWLEAINIMMTDPQEKKDQFYNNKKMKIVHSYHNSPLKNDNDDEHKSNLSLNLNSGLLMKRKGEKSRTFNIDEKMLEI